MKWIAIAALLIAFFWAACHSENQQSVADKVGSETSAINPDDTINSILHIPESLFKVRNLRKKDPSLEQYLLSSPNRPDSVRNVIYLLPLGNFNKDQIRLIQDQVNYLKAFFQMDVKVMEQVSMEEVRKDTLIKIRMLAIPAHTEYMKAKMSSHGPQYQQVEALSLLSSSVLSRKPADASVIVGITDFDLYTGSLNFIFGTSTEKQGTAVVSLNRFYEAPDISNNLRKLISRQIVCAFSIKPVTDYECLTNYSNSLEEFESKPYYLSPDALTKLKVCIGFDYRREFQDLARFWDKAGNTGMKQFYLDCLQSMN